MTSAPLVGVVGPGAGVQPADLVAAELVGRGLAEAGCVVVTGGLEGVMAAASCGAKSVGGLVVGLLPGSDRTVANPCVDVAIATGLGEMRNALIVRACDALVSVGGSWGTLSEVALAVRTGVPLFAVGGWDLPDGGPLSVQTPAAAVDAVLEVLAQAQSDGSAP